MIPLETLTIFLTSLITFTFIYYQVQTITMLQVIASLLFFLLLFLNRFTFTPIKHLSSSLQRFVALFLGSLFVQMLVIATGGFLSPLLILLHLFTIGAGFLVNFQSAIVFLVFSVADLVAAIIFTPKLNQLYQQDQWSVALYFMSFIIIIPLVVYLMRSYHVKSAIAKVLADYSDTMEQREESLFRSLKELIVVTDINLHIISVNRTLEKLLNITNSQVMNHFLFDTIHLKDQNGNIADIHSLSVDDVLVDKATRIVKGFVLVLNNNESEEMTIQVRPIVDSEGKVTQLVFVLNSREFERELSNSHQDLQTTKLNNQRMVGEIENSLVQANQPVLAAQVELYSKNNEDLLTALELEDHRIDDKKSLENVTFICKQLLEGRRALAKAFNVKLDLLLPDNEVEEYSLLKMIEEKSPYVDLSTSHFTLPINRQWFSSLILRLVDLGILLSSSAGGGQVQIKLSRLDGKQININIVSTCPVFVSDPTKDLFEKYYNQLGKTTSLQYGSGLEGYIAKTIASQLDMKFETTYQKNSSFITFSFQLDRGVKA